MPAPPRIREKRMTPGGRGAARRAPMAASGALAGGMLIHPAEGTTPGWPRRQALCRFGTVRVISGHKSRRAGRLPSGQEPVSIERLRKRIAISGHLAQNQLSGRRGSHQCERCSARANPLLSGLPQALDSIPKSTERQNLSGGAIELLQSRAGRHRHRAATC